MIRYQLLCIAGLCTFALNPVALAQSNTTTTGETIVLPAPTARTQAVQQEVAMTEAEPDIRGLLVSRNEGTMNSLMTARVSKVHVKVGNRVKAGQTLVSFDCADLKARILSASARLKQHRLILDANRELEVEQAVTKLDLMMAEAKVEEGEADVQSAEAQLARCFSKAPYASVITDVKIAANESVQIGDPLVDLMDDRRLDMVVHIPSDWIKRNLVGKRFDVMIDETGSTYAAEIKRVTPKIDAASGTVEVTAKVIGKHPELLPGMSGAAQFPDQ